MEHLHVAQGPVADSERDDRTVSEEIVSLDVEHGVKHGRLSVVVRQHPGLEQQENHNGTEGDDPHGRDEEAEHESNPDDVQDLSVFRVRKIDGTNVELDVLVQRRLLGVFGDRRNLLNFNLVFIFFIVVFYFFFHSHSGAAREATVQDHLEGSHAEADHELDDGSEGSNDHCLDKHRGDREVPISVEVGVLLPEKQPIERNVHKSEVGIDEQSNDTSVDEHGHKRDDHDSADSFRVRIVSNLVHKALDNVSQANVDGGYKAGDHVVQ